MDAVKPANTGDAAAEVAVEMDMLDSPLVLDAAVEDEIEMIVKCLEEIARVLTNPDSVIVCSTIFLLLTKLFVCILQTFWHTNDTSIVTTFKNTSGKASRGSRKFLEFWMPKEWEL